MESIAQSPTPARRAPAAKSPRRAKKMPEAAIEATAEAFMAGFKALPGAVQWRIVQKIEAYEDELDEAQLTADKAANPEDYDSKNAVPWEQVKAEMEAQRKALSPETLQQQAA